MKTFQDRGMVQYCISLKQMREDQEAERLPSIGTHTAIAMRKQLGFISSANVCSKIQMFFSFSLCGLIQHLLKSMGDLPMSLKKRGNF